MRQYFRAILRCCCCYSANVIGGARNFCYLGKANHHPQKNRFRVKRYFGLCTISVNVKFTPKRLVVFIIYVVIKPKGKITRGFYFYGA